MAYRNQKINPDRFHPSQIKFYIITGLMALFMLLPIIFIIVHAFKPMSELLEYPPKFYVMNPTLDNFRNLFRQTTNSSIPFSRYLFNSIIVTLIGVAATIFVTSLTAFVLSKLRFKGKRLIFKINEAAMMFVGSALVIPRYLVISSLGITNTIFAHIIPLLAMPVGLFLVKQFIEQRTVQQLRRVGGQGTGRQHIQHGITLWMPNQLEVVFFLTTEIVGQPAQWCSPQSRGGSLTQVAVNEKHTLATNRLNQCQVHSHKGLADLNLCGFK